jgi:hypothetical protein
MQEIIQVGEVLAGCLYILAGAGFLLLSKLSDKHSIVMIAAAGIFIAAGVEEVGDALFAENADGWAVAVHFLCTLSQVIFNSLAVWTIYHATKFRLQS